MPGGRSTRCSSGFEGGRRVKNRLATDAIRALAERQHGVVALRQLQVLGVGEDLIRHRVNARLLIPLYRGVFALGHRRLSQEGYWISVVLACGPGAVLSHASALDLWSVRGSRGPVDVLRRSGGEWYPRTGIRLHQTRSLPPDHITEERGIPVTSLERSLRDMARHLTMKQLERAVVAADRTGQLHWPQLVSLVGSSRGHKGIGRLRAVVHRIHPHARDARSGLEVDFLALCREEGLPAPAVNVLVHGYLVDFLWPAQRVVVETDTYRYHGDRAAFESDHERTAALIAAGYDVHRATRQLLQRHRDLFLRNVRLALTSRTASNSTPSRPGT